MTPPCKCKEILKYLYNWSDEMENSLLKKSREFEDTIDEERYAYRAVQCDIFKSVIRTECRINDITLEEGGEDDLAI